VRTYGADFERAHMIRSASVTHSFDFNQRFVELETSFTEPSPGVFSVTVNTPVHDDAAPKGWYMLFVVDSNGIPSIAEWVKL
jgi:hypothetical protein